MDRGERPRLIREALAWIANAATLVAIACCWYAWNRPIVRHDAGDPAYTPHEHRVAWSRWSVIAAGLALVLCVR